LIPAVLLAVWAALQLVPLPPPLLRALSPKAHQIYVASLPGYPGAVAAAGLLSLDDLVGNQEGERTTRVIDLVCSKSADSPSAPIEVEEMREALAQSILNLPDKERTVLALYYYEDMTLKEIGRTLGVSESRISQIHTKAVLRLKGRLRVARESLLATLGEKDSGEIETPAPVADQVIARQLASTH
jgi:DNA-binding CsgD family transcriptional regulator